MRSGIMLRYKLVTFFVLECDVNIDARDHPSGGVFTSPGFPDDYGNNLRCIYRFTGRPNQRVKIAFDEFGVRGVPPGYVANTF